MSTQNNYPLLQTLYKMVLKGNTNGVEFHGPFVNPPKHDLWLCNHLASQLSDEGLVVMADGDNDDSHMAPLKNLLDDFFSISVECDGPHSVGNMLATKQGKAVKFKWVPLF